MDFDKFIITYIYHYSVIKNSLPALKTPVTPPFYPSSHSLATTDLFTISMVLSFPECHLVGITQYVAFSDWLLSLDKIHLKFFHVFLWLESAFHFSTELYSIVWMYHSLFIHSPIEWHLSCFQFLEVMNKVAVSIYMQVSVWT